MTQQEINFDASLPPWALSELGAEAWAWIHTLGGRHVLKDLYIMAYPYAKRYMRTGQRVSIKMLWELERDKITTVRRRMKARGYDLEKYKNYRLNNIFHAFVSKHIEDHKPEWRGMFEHRCKKTVDNSLDI